MKKYFHLFTIVMLVSCLVIGINGCDEQTTNQIDNVVNGGTETPSTEPEPEPEPVEPTEPQPTEPEPVSEPVEPEPIQGMAVTAVPAQTTSPAAGQQLQVRIEISGAADVSGYDVTLIFDPTALKYVSSANADYLPAGAFVAPAQVTANSVYLSAVSLSGAANAASGTLATITFEVLTAKASALTFSEVVLTDANGQALTFTPVNGQLNAP